MRPRLLLAPAALAVTLLAGCTFSVGAQHDTVDPGVLAEKTADALEDSVGLRPDIDCGTDPIPVSKKSTATCLLTDPATGLEFDVLLTFTSVEPGARDYTFDIKVADTANNAAVPTAAPGASVPISDIEQLAVQALAPQLGLVPSVDCAGDEVEIVVGATVDCRYDAGDGAVPIVVTITSFDATTGRYGIAVDPA